jgi:hypothetical protein
MLGPPQKGRDDGRGIPVSRQFYLFDALGKNSLSGEDLLDPVTVGSSAEAQPGPYTNYLKFGALKGKRFAVSMPAMV